MERTEIEAKLTDLLVDEPGIDRDAIAADAKFEEDLDVDSLGVVELLMALDPKRWAPLAAKWPAHFQNLHPRHGTVVARPHVRRYGRCHHGRLVCSHLADDYRSAGFLCSDVQTEKELRRHPY